MPGQESGFFNTPRSFHDSPCGSYPIAARLKVSVAAVLSIPQTVTAAHISTFLTAPARSRTPSRYSKQWTGHGLEFGELRSTPPADRPFSLAVVSPGVLHPVLQRNQPLLPRCPPCCFSLQDRPRQSCAGRLPLILHPSNRHSRFSGQVFSMSSSSGATRQGRFCKTCRTERRSAVTRGI